MRRILHNQCGRTINPAQVTILIVGVIVAFLWGSLSGRVESEGIQNILILCIKTVLAVALLAITVMVLYYFGQFLFDVSFTIG